MLKKNLSYTLIPDFIYNRYTLELYVSSSFDKESYRYTKSSKEAYLLDDYYLGKANESAHRVFEKLKKSSHEIKCFTDLKPDFYFLVMNPYFGIFHEHSNIHVMAQANNMMDFSWVNVDTFKEANLMSFLTYSFLEDFYSSLGIDTSALIQFDFNNKGIFMKQEVNIDFGKASDKKNNFNVHQQRALGEMCFFRELNKTFGDEGRYNLECGFNFSFYTKKDKGVLKKQVHYLPNKNALASSGHLFLNGLVKKCFENGVWKV